MRISYRAIYHPSLLVRRLRYISQLLQIVGQGPQNKDILTVKLREWSIKHADKLTKYKYNIGAAHSTKKIKATHIAENYLALSVEFGLLSEISNVFHLTRIGRVIYGLLNNDHSKEKISFFLNKDEKLFYIFQLLQQDADNILTTLNMVQLLENTDLKILKQNFYKFFVDRLKAKIAACSQEHITNQLHDRIIKVTEEWKKPEAYASYFLPPRLNWLLDLGLLDVNRGIRSNVYQLTESGHKMVESLPILDNSNIPDVTDDWFNTKYFSEITPIILSSKDIKFWQEVDDKIRQTACEKYLPIAFEKFRNSSVPKVSLKQTILFLCLRFGIELKLITNFNELIQWFQMPRVLGDYIYEVRISARENESYIVRRNA